jgi:methylenetetrahydrofolate dehydrogenase (NADP+)/methenyltetrahydrofolate cyclohydrolase
MARRMTAEIIDGKAFAANLRASIAEDVATFREQAGRTPGLAVVLVGDDPASPVYVRNKGKATREAGMESLEHRLPGSASQEELIALVETLNADPTVDGILVQLPLPGQIDERVVVAAIDPDKDVDGLTTTNAGRLANNMAGLVPCTPLGCILLLKDQLGDLKGLEAVVIGRSILVGKPMAQLLLAENCTVTVAHSRTRGLDDVVRRADIVVAAVGIPHMVKGDWIKPGATVIDVGINRTANGLVGDVDFASAASHVAAITPVPGGVGPMTIACLLANTLTAARRREGLGGEGLA